MINFTNSLIEFYFMMIVVTTIWIFVANMFSFNYTMGILKQSSSDSANVAPQWMFRPWKFPLNIGLNMLPSGSFMLFLDSLGYYRIFTGEFHALQLIVLTVFGAVD